MPLRFGYVKSRHDDHRDRKTLCTRHIRQRDLLLLVHRASQTRQILGETKRPCVWWYTRDLYVENPTVASVTNRQQGQRAMTYYRYLNFPTLTECPRNIDIARLHLHLNWFPRWETFTPYGIHYNTNTRRLAKVTKPIGCQRSGKTR